MAKGLDSVELWQEVLPQAILAAVFKDAQHLAESPNFWIPEASQGKRKALAWAISSLTAHLHCVTMHSKFVAHAGTARREHPDVCSGVCNCLAVSKHYQEAPS